MEPRIYLGAASFHVHCEQYNFKAGEIFKLFGNENVDDRTTWLDIRNCTGTIDSSVLRLLASLEILNISDSTIELLPGAFSSLLKLQSLNIRKSKVSISKEIFKDCTVNRLSIKDLTISGIDNFSHLPLTSLTIENCHLDNFSGNINNLHVLDFLYIKNCRIKGFGDISSSEKIEYLLLFDNEIEDFNIEYILNMPNLKHFSFVGNKIVPEINYEDFKNIATLETIMFDTHIYKSLDFNTFPNLKKIQIATYGGECTDEEKELMARIEKDNKEFEYQFCGKIEVDMSKVMVCA